jgi:hypothetical protein
VNASIEVEGVHEDQATDDGGRDVIARPGNRGKRMHPSELGL